MTEIILKLKHNSNSDVVYNPEIYFYGTEHVRIKQVSLYFCYRNNMGVKVKQVSVFTNENPSAVLTGLHPYTAYQITVSAVNKIGTSIESQLSDIFYTDSEGMKICIV